MENSGPQQETNPIYLSIEKWLADKGDAEFALYQKEATTTPLTFDQWAASEQARGLYLAEITSIFWDLISSDDESEEDAESAPVPAPAARTAPAGEKSIVNGNGTHRTAGAAVTDVSNGVDALATGRKKRRKSKKKSDPEETILQDGVDENSAPLPDSETVTPKPAIKRGRPSKKFTTVAHANEVADSTTTPTANDAALSGTAASPGSPNAGSATRPGLRTRTPAQQRPYFHHAKLFEEAIDKVVDEPKPSKAKSKLVHVSFPAEELDEFDQQVHEDEGILEKPVGTKGRKKLNDEVDTDFKPPKIKGKKTGKGKSPAQADPAEAPVTQPNADDRMPQNGTLNGEIEKPKKRRGRPPKARLSLDDQEAGALDHSVLAAGLKASLHSRSQQPQSASASKEGRKKRVHKSEEFVHFSDDEDEEMQDADLEAGPENEPHPSGSRPAHNRRWSGRKSLLSSEYIHDSDDSDVEHSDIAAEDLNGPLSREARQQIQTLNIIDAAEDDTNSALSDAAISPIRIRNSAGKTTTSAPGTAVASPSVGRSTARRSAPPPGSSPTTVRKKPRRKSKYTVGRDIKEMRAAAKIPRRKKQFLSAEIIDDDSDDLLDDDEELDKIDPIEYEELPKDEDIEMADVPGASSSGLEEAEEDSALPLGKVTNGAEEGSHDREEEPADEVASATTPRKTPGRPRKTPQSARVADLGSANQTQTTPSKRGKKKSM